MQTRKYLVSALHDKGQARLYTTVICKPNTSFKESKQQAIQQVMEAEGCPERAIIGAGLEAKAIDKAQVKMIFKLLKKRADKIRSIANTDTATEYYKLVDELKPDLVEFLRMDFRCLNTQQVLELSSWVSSWRPVELHSFLITLSNLNDLYK